MTQIIKLDYKDFGLEKTKAQEIEEAFTPMVEAMEALQSEYEQVMAMPINEESIELAATVRKKYVKVRTGTAKAHKEQKEPFLKAGKFIDGLKNAQLKASEFYENDLRSIEDHFLNAEKQRLIDLQKERVEQIRPYVDEASTHPDYAGMPVSIWTIYLNNAKHEFENPKSEPVPWRHEDIIALIKWLWVEGAINDEDAEGILKEFINLHWV